MAVTDERVSRGKLLKRAGIGAAAVGAASMVTAATAGAGAPTSVACVAAGGCGCGGGCVKVGGGSGCCYCFTTTEGCCFAAENVYCAGLQTCTSSKQCPPGWNCIANTGCGAGVCAPHCGASTGHNVCGVESGPSKYSGKTAASV